MKVVNGYEIKAEANLIGANLTGADLTEAYLTEAYPKCLPK